MGIKVEFNPDLALRDISEFKKGNRRKEKPYTKGKYKITEVFDTKDSAIHFEGLTKIK